MLLCGHDDASAERLHEAAGDDHDGGGEQARYGDAHAGHGAFQLAHLKGFRGAHRVAAGADGHALGDAVVHAEDLRHERREDGAEDAGDDDGRHGDGRDASQLLRYGDGDGGGRGFGDERRSHLVAQAEQLAERVCADHRHDRAYQAAAEDGDEVLLEDLALAVDRIRQGDRRRPQQKRDELHAGLVGIQRDVEDAQERDDDRHRHQQRVEQRGAHLLVQRHGQLEHDEGDDGAYGQGCDEVQHRLSLLAGDGGDDAGSRRMRMVLAGALAMLAVGVGDACLGFRRVFRLNSGG